MFLGQSFFAQFAIMETNCTDKEAPQKEESCKALCEDQAVSAQEVHYFITNFFNYYN